MSQINKDIDQAEDQKKHVFWKDVVEVEKKHGYKIVALMEYHAQGIRPVFGISKVESSSQEISQEIDKTV